MRMLPLAIAAAVALSPPLQVLARERAHGVARATSGKIERSPRARAEFKHSNPCPSTGRPSGGCPGYIIDHIVALKRGGADHAGNMQWQTIAAAREKDRWE